MTPTRRRATASQPDDPEAATQEQVTEEVKSEGATSGDAVPAKPESAAASDPDQAPVAPQSPPEKEETMTPTPKQAAGIATAPLPITANDKIKALRARLKAARAEQEAAEKDRAVAKQAHDEARKLEVEVRKTNLAASQEVARTRSAYESAHDRVDVKVRMANQLAGELASLGGTEKDPPAK
jgi:hypothetical protein